tara:strand:- start:181417 stop:182019 length:603 start_codon:yes stop_codon:yes gene_type:complete
MNIQQKKEKLEEIRKELIKAKKAPLYSYRKENNYLPVPGEGRTNAKIVMVGEAPGKNEAETGRPFCGQTGKILDELFESINLDRESVFVTSVVKDRPQKNRDPTKEEIAWYAPYLDRQIEIIAPKVVVALGRFAMEYLFDRYGVDIEKKTISELHGSVFEGKVGAQRIKIVALYHPSASIYNQKLKSVIKEDFKVLKQFV